jgi:sugar/nucleoside kinase (ribokinase family)
VTGRKGIYAAGNWVVDYIKTIDRLPAAGMLCNIVSQFKSLGGGAHNVLVNLAHLDPELPLFAGGIIGTDCDADLILSALTSRGIDTSAMQRRPDCQTSFTDVMTEAETGVRTFFLSRGGNALLDADDICRAENSARIAHLAYLLILDRLDSPDPEYGVRAGRALADLRSRGYKTSLDLVSVEGGRFREVVHPALPHVDWLIINEIEAGHTADLPLRDGSGALLAGNLPRAAEILFGLGLNEYCVIHYPEGSFAMDRSGRQWQVPGYKLSKGEIVGTVGAGDAFCAGVLYGLHESWPMEKSLRLATAMAARSLSSADSTGSACKLETYGCI